jgi:hypothetical protein
LYNLINIYHFNKRKSVYFLCIVLTFVIIQSLSIKLVSDNKIFAIAPSFVRQEIIDDSNDWELWKSKSDITPIFTHEEKTIKIQNARDITECQIFGDYLIPDIESVSYTSDGNKLNATIWLTGEFKEPLLIDTIDTYQEELKIIKTDTNNKTLEDHILNKKAQIDPTRFSILEENNISFANNYTGYKIIYSSLNDVNQLKTLHIITIINNNLYEFIFTALNDSYEDYQPDIQQLLNSFRINDYDYNNNNKNKNQSVNYNNNDNQKKDMKIYNNNTIYLSYPNSWKLLKEQKEKYTDRLTITFQTPFEDTLINEPSWQETTYTMALDINSVHDTGTDYRMILKRDNIEGEVKESYWNKEIQEISAYNKYAIINISQYENNLSNSNRIPLSFDLKTINYPESYKLIFFITNYYVYNHQLCRLIDTTNWVLAPPPEFNISFSPHSIDLRPGEDKNIGLSIKGNSNIESKLKFDIDQTYDNIVRSSFFPPETTIPASGEEGTSTLNIKIPANASVNELMPLSIPVYTNISFPNLISNRGGDVFFNNKTVSLSEFSSLSVSVLPPYTIQERLNNIVNSWISPLSSLWTFLAGIGAVIVPLIIKFYSKKNKVKQEKI